MATTEIKIIDESLYWDKDPEYVQELSRRTKLWNLNLAGTDRDIELQEALDDIGSGFRRIRKIRGYNMRNVAEFIGTTPQMLLFLESGLITTEELYDFIGKWHQLLF